MLSEKVTRPHVRANRPILIPSVPVSEGIEIRHRCQFLSSLVRALAKLPGGLARFVPCHLGFHMPRLRHLGWSQCSHGLFSRPLESCHHQCLKALCGVLGVSQKGQLRSFWMALLSSVTVPLFLPHVFTLGLYPGLEMGVVNGSLVLLVIILTKAVIWVKGSGLPRRHVFSHCNPDPGHPTPRRWKRLRLPPSSEGVEGEVGEPRNLFPRLGVG